MKDLRPSVVLACLLLPIVVIGAACGGTAPEAISPSRTPGATAQEAAQEAAQETVQNKLSFVTIAQEAPLGDEPAEAAYAVIAGPEGWERAGERLPADAVEAGQNAEDGQVFFVAFSGASASSGYEIAIRSIVARGDELVVTVAEMRPGDEEIVEPAMTVPFHLVAVAGDAIPEGVTAVRFQDESGQTLAEIAYPPS